ncbi:MAG: PEP-CTERM sorting domain-containing protein [Acidobacteriota bacterium]
MKRALNLLIAMLVVVSLASAASLGPRRPPRHGGGPIRSVAEPATIALLGAGLVSLGIYAKRKRGKKN